MMPSSASRGIGLELVRQLLESPANLVVAACRSPETATTLGELNTTSKGNLHTVKLDVSDSDSVRAAVKEMEPILGETGLDYLINNAAIVRIPTLRPNDPNFLTDRPLCIPNIGRRGECFRFEP